MSLAFFSASDSYAQEYSSEAIAELKREANSLYRERRFAESLILLQEISSSRDAPIAMRLDAHRLSAQIQRQNHDFDEAVASYESMIDIIESSSSNREQAFYYGEAIEKLSATYHQMGDDIESVRWGQRFLDEAIADPRRRQIQYVNLAEGYRSISDFEQAVKTYDHLFLEYPDYGREDGRVVNIRVRQINAHGYPTRSDERMELMHEFWNNDDYIAFPQFYTVGKNLVYHYMRSNELERAEEVAEQFLDRVRLIYPDMTDDQIEEYHLDRNYFQVLETQFFRKYAQADWPAMLKLGNEIGSIFPNTDLAKRVRILMVEWEEQWAGLDPTVILTERFENSSSDTLAVQEELIDPITPSDRPLLAEASTGQADTGSSSKLALLIGIPAGTAALGVLVLLAFYRRSHRGVITKTCG